MWQTYKEEYRDFSTAEKDIRIFHRHKIENLKFWKHFFPKKSFFQPCLDWSNKQMLHHNHFLNMQFHTGVPDSQPERGGYPPEKVEGGRVVLQEGLRRGSQDDSCLQQAIKIYMSWFVQSMMMMKRHVELKITLHWCFICVMMILK